MYESLRYYKIKSLDKEEYMKHPREVFEVLMHNKMMLNPTRCVFEVGSENSWATSLSGESRPMLIRFLVMEPSSFIKNIEKLNNAI